MVPLAIDFHDVPSVVTYGGVAGHRFSIHAGGFKQAK